MNRLENKEEYFTQLYNQYYQNVLRICRGYVYGNIDAANDLAQDVFSRVWQNLESFNANSKISTWIYRITVNTCLLYKRKSKREIRIYKEYLTGENEDYELLDLRMKKMLEAIDKLTAQNRSIILLELESLPQKEIADIMGMSHSAVRVRILRIKEKLSKFVRDA